MNEKQHVYIAIDLKSFYASVECVERGLDPLRYHLVVADASRTDKTVCLAVSPSLKAYGIGGRSRLFEVVQKVREINAGRRLAAPRHSFNGESADSIILGERPDMALAYIVAPPQMALYVEYSTRIYDIYLRYIAPEDIHVYSIDEVFIDATRYLRTYRTTPHDLTMKMLHQVLGATGITATAGIGSNLYLAKIAMDIKAKHNAPDKDGVRIAALDEISYRRELWEHRPLTDFWRIGRGYARKLEANRMFTMGDVARCTLGKANEFRNEKLLYKLFGINAELLIDHAWGWEPCTIDDIKSYRPATNSISRGQVLHCAYNFAKTQLIVQEMTDLLALDLVSKHLVTDQIVLTIGYDVENLLDPKLCNAYHGEVVVDYYGRRIPKPAHGSVNLGRHTSSVRLIMHAVMGLFAQIVDRKLLSRRINIAANHVLSEGAESLKKLPEQLGLFVDNEALAAECRREEAALLRERHLQEAILMLKKRYGKNAVLKGMNLEDGATTKERNNQIGGHKA